MSSHHNTLSPLALALWFLVGGVSFGMATGAGWLIVLGLTAPIAWLAIWLLWSLLR